MPRISTVPDRLRQRKIIRRVVASALLLLSLAAILNHAGVFGRYRIGDWSRFDHRSAVITDVIDGNTVVFQTAGKEVRARLIGIDAPKLKPLETAHPDHWAAESKAYLTDRLKGKTVAVRLEQTQSRDRNDRLLVYLFLDEFDNVNQDAIRDGAAYADSRFEHSLRPQFQQIEADARKKKRGLWADLKEDEMPAWRQEWLKHRRERDRPETK